jgi:hypothetical protein
VMAFERVATPVRADATRPRAHSGVSGGSGGVLAAVLSAWTSSMEG